MPSSYHVAVRRWWDKPESRQNSKEAGLRKCRPRLGRYSKDERRIQMGGEAGPLWHVHQDTRHADIWTDQLIKGTEFRKQLSTYCRAGPSTLLCPAWRTMWLPTSQQPHMHASSSPPPAPALPDRGLCHTEEETPASPFCP